jgi:hypothetical protein
MSGDTMEMLRAVLDTNFWLATHVVVVTLGYSATFVAGFLAVLYVILGFFTSSLTPDMARAVSPAWSTASPASPPSFSFVGTVLGGIWADQSWGRFWGWDPEGKRRPDHRHLERLLPPRPLGPADGQGTRSSICRRHRRQHRSPRFSWFGQHARHRPPRLRVHGAPPSSG